MKAQRAGGTHLLRRSGVLRRLVEQHIVGTVLARLEPARVCLFAAARLPLVPQLATHLALLSHTHHFSTQRLRARTGHVVPLQEAPRLFAGHADDAITAYRRQSTMDAGEGSPRQSDILEWHFRRVRSSFSFLPP